MIQRDQLTEAQSTRIKQLKERLIPIGNDAVRIWLFRRWSLRGPLIQQLLGLLYGQGSGQRLRGFGGPYIETGVGPWMVPAGFEPRKKASPGQIGRASCRERDGRSEKRDSRETKRTKKD